MVTLGGIENALKATSTIHEASHLSPGLEDLDTRTKLHA